MNSTIRPSPALSINTPRAFFFEARANAPFFAAIVSDAPCLPMNAASWTKRLRKRRAPTSKPIPKCVKSSFREGTLLPRRPRSWKDYSPESGPGRPGILIRLCTRAPVTLPERIDEELVAMLSRYKPLRVVIQVNHPMELSEVFAEKIELLLRAGLPVRSQTVLLRGINDSTDTLEALFAGLVRAGVDPYYLFQGDMAAGTSHFRVPLSQGPENV